jgi:hypothetical protein
MIRKIDWRSQDESDGGEQCNNQKTKTMTTKRMKRKSHLTKAMAKNTTSKRRSRGWPRRWKEVHKTKAMVENTITIRRPKWQQPRGWKKD